MQISNLIIEELIHSGIACKGRKNVFSSAALFPLQNDSMMETFHCLIVI